MTRHLYGISALVSQTSFRGETSGGVAKYLLFPEADKCWLVSLSILKVGMFVTFVYSIKDNGAKIYMELTWALLSVSGSISLMSRIGMVSDGMIDERYFQSHIYI